MQNKVKIKAKNLNLKEQYYKGIPITQIRRVDYNFQGARRFLLGKSSQNVWIPNCYLELDGTLKENINIDFIFKKAYIQKKLEYAKIDINPFDWR